MELAAFGCWTIATHRDSTAFSKEVQGSIFVPPQITVRAHGKVAKRACFDWSGYVVARPEVVGQKGLIATLASGASAIPFAFHARAVDFLSCNGQDLSWGDMFRLSLDVRLKNLTVGELPKIDVQPAKAMRETWLREEVDVIVNKGKKHVVVRPAQLELIGGPAALQQAVSRANEDEEEVQEWVEWPCFAIESHLDPHCWIIMDDHGQMDVIPRN